jgi:hypothetical protein
LNSLAGERISVATPPGKHGSQFKNRRKEKNMIDSQKNNPVNEAGNHVVVTAQSGRGLACEIGKRPSVDEVIDEILSSVDKCPAALQKYTPLDFLEESVIVEKFFSTPDADLAWEQLTNILEHGKEPGMDFLNAIQILFEWSSSKEAEAAAIGYAAGLRAAGLSREQTRKAMLGFLRLWCEEPGL